MVAISAAALLGLGWSCALQSFTKGGPQLLASGGAGGAGGRASTTMGSGGVGAACQSDAYPVPPTVNDTNTKFEFYAAIRSVYFTDEDSRPVGVDLDRRCTCDPTGYDEGPSCQHEPGVDTICDLGNGRDNAFYEIVQLVKILFQLDFESSFSESSEDGSATLLFRVQDYNGLPDDPKVRVSVYSGSGRTTPPAWDGTDTWPVSQASIVEGGTTIDEPRYYDDAAYVTNGRLVSGLNSSVVSFAGSNGRIDLELLGGGLVADVQDGDDGWELRNGVFTGLLSEEGLFRSVASYRDQAGMAFCPDSSAYRQGAFLFCNARDSSVNPNPGPTAPCDAISFAMGFTAEPASGVEAITPVPPSSDPCMGDLPTSCESFLGAGGGGGAGGN